MIEFEKKLLLTKNEYLCLLECFGQGIPSVKQTNYYFDTNTFVMNNRNITCRIRLKSGNYKATLKKHIPADDMSAETLMYVRDGVKDNEFIDMGLTLQGELVTERTVLLKTDECEVVLDKNTYLNTEDYELEVEYLFGNQEKAQKILNSILEPLFVFNKNLTAAGISGRIKNAKSKSKRFFERRDKM